MDGGGSCGCDGDGGCDGGSALEATSVGNEETVAVKGGGGCDVSLVAVMRGGSGEAVQWCWCGSGEAVKMVKTQWR